jgi:outer membrane protein OmpA-like peptidoglycan-associated protein
MKTKPGILFCMVLFTMIYMTSCDFINNLINPTAKERVITYDAKPPAGYSPVFMGSIQPIANLTDSTPVNVFVEQTETSVNNVKVRVSIIDSNGIYYTGAATKANRKIWCLIEEDADGKTYKINDYSITEATKENADPVAIAIVMDHSGSMGDTRARQMQQAVVSLIKKMRPGDAISLIKYDNKVLTEVALTTEQSQLLSGFKTNGLEGFGYTTAVANGVMEAVNQLKNAVSFKRKYVVVFTDGKDNSSTVTPKSAIKAANKNKIRVMAVNFGANTEPEYMRPFADSTGGKEYHIYSTGEFQLLFEDIYNRVNNYYTIEYTPRTFGKRNFRLKLCPPGKEVLVEHSYNYMPVTGSVINLNINFDVAKSTIKSEYKSDIETLAKFLKSYPSLKIEVAGHTDSDGSDKLNQELSQRRAESVKNALAKEGVAEERITAVGYGETKPIDSNETAEGKARNRRTEIKILE